MSKLTLVRFVQCGILRRFLGSSWIRREYQVNSDEKIMKPETDHTLQKKRKIIFAMLSQVE